MPQRDLRQHAEWASDRETRTLENNLEQHIGLAAMFLLLLLSTMGAACTASVSASADDRGGSPWPASATARAAATLAKMSTADKLTLTYGLNKPPARCAHDFSLCPKWYVGKYPFLLPTRRPVECQ